MSELKGWEEKMANRCEQYGEERGASHRPYHQYEVWAENEEHGEGWTTLLQTDSIAHAEGLAHIFRIHMKRRIVVWDDRQCDVILELND